MKLDSHSQYSGNGSPESVESQIRRCRELFTKLESQMSSKHICFIQSQSLCSERLSELLNLQKNGDLTRLLNLIPKAMGELVTELFKLDELLNALDDSGVEVYVKPPALAAEVNCCKEELRK